jgi:uncharacterized protein YneF (UPF0154 family)
MNHDPSLVIILTAFLFFIAGFISGMFISWIRERLKDEDEQKTTQK